MPLTWKNWYTLFQIYLRANNLEEIDDKRKVAILLHLMGPDSLAIFHSSNENIDTVQCLLFSQSKHITEILFLRRMYKSIYSSVWKRSKFWKKNNLFVSPENDSHSFHINNAKFTSCCERWNIKLFKEVACYLFEIKGK